MSFAPDEYPLFPLSLVLFPGGSLSLRIFEPRYLALVRDCARDNREFGVTLLMRREDDADSDSTLAIGTLARIVDFYTLPDGLLGIRAEGGARFHIDSASARDDGLLIGKLELWPDEPQRPVPPEYALLSTLAENLLEKIFEGQNLPTKAQLDDTSWISFRLAEILPFTLGQCQQLLEMTDPSVRLQAIVDALPRFRSERTTDDPDDDPPSL